MQQRYTLRPRWKATIGPIVFFAACAVVCGCMAIRRGGANNALHDDAGLVFGGCAVLSVLLIAVSAFTHVRLASGALHVDIDDDGITLPGKVMWPRPRRFAWDGITRTELSIVNHVTFLTVTDNRGSSHLARIHLAADDFDAIAAIVAERAPRAQLPAATRRRR